MKYKSSVITFSTTEATEWRHNEQLPQKPTWGRQQALKLLKLDKGECLNFFPALTGRKVAMLRHGLKELGYRLIVRKNGKSNTWTWRGDPIDPIEPDGHVTTGNVLDDLGLSESKYNFEYRKPVSHDA